MPEPTWSEKILRLHDALEGTGVAYAFGGAIALNYHREPRATLDIDINVFAAPDNPAAALQVLTDLYGLPDRARVEKDLDQQGQARSLWGATYIDLFFSNTEFHDSMSQRIERQPFDGAQLPVLSIEDLVVCKALFDRPKDWLDIAAVVETRRQPLDLGYIRSWLTWFLGDGDQRVNRLDEMTRPAST